MTPLPNPVRLVWSKAITSCGKRPGLLWVLMATVLWLAVFSVGLLIWVAFG